MADRIGILHEGELVQVGSPRDIYERPANLHVAARLGQPAINLIDPGLIPGQGIPAETNVIGVRTEHMEIQPATNGSANAEIDWIEHLGDQKHLHLKCQGKKLISLADPYSPLKAGDRVALSLTNPLYFGADGRRIG